MDVTFAAPKKLYIKKYKYFQPETKTCHPTELLLQAAQYVNIWARLKSKDGFMRFQDMATPWEKPFMVDLHRSNTNLQLMALGWSSNWLYLFIRENIKPSDDHICGSNHYFPSVTWLVSRSSWMNNTWWEINEESRLSCFGVRYI